MAPAAISNDIPPSIGMQGGGQHPGVSPPPGGGGGGGKATHTAAKPNVKINTSKSLVFINVPKIDCKYIKNNRTGNSCLKIVPNYYICMILKLFRGTKKEYFTDTD